MKFRGYFRSGLLAEFVVIIKNITQRRRRGTKHSLKSMGADDVTSY